MSKWIICIPHILLSALIVLSSPNLLLLIRASYS